MHKSYRTIMINHMRVSVSDCKLLGGLTPDLVQLDIEV